MLVSVDLGQEAVCKVLMSNISLLPAVGHLRPKREMDEQLPYETRQGMIHLMIF